jgi:hypothetical protein
MPSNVKANLLHDGIVDTLVSVGASERPGLPGVILLLWMVSPVIHRVSSDARKAPPMSSGSAMRLSACRRPVVSFRLPNGFRRLVIPTL